MPSPIEKKWLNDIKELYSEELDTKELLCPDFFDTKTELMLDDVRDSLLEIAHQFYQDLKNLKDDAIDVVLVGAMANYNWGRDSEAQICLIMPDDDDVEMSIEPSRRWNDKNVFNEEGHRITMFVFNKELIQSRSEQGEGVYSILFNKWLSEPNQSNVNIDWNQVLNFFSNFAFDAFDLQKKLTGTDKCYGGLKQIRSLIGDMWDQRIKDMANGNNNAGAAFGALDGLGILQRLKKLENEILDQSGVPRKEDDSISPEIPSRRDRDLEDSEPKKDVGKGRGRYLIMGRRFISLRQAEKMLGIPKSTLQYRVKSDNPKFSAYKELY